MKDFTILGFPCKELVQDLQQQEYDIVIDLNQSNALPLRYLCLLAKAGFKSGIAPIGQLPNTPMAQSPCDLLIHTQPQETPEFLFQQILYYLTNIQSND